MSYEEEQNQSAAACAKTSSVLPFLFLGNAVWLDFVNTEIVDEGTRVDLLTSDATLQRWLTESGVLVGAGFGTGASRELSKTQGEELLSSARELRATLRSIAGEMAQGTAVPGQAIDALNGLLRLQTPRLVWRKCRWVQELAVEAGSGLQALVAVARSAADTLSSSDAHLVRQCEGRGCILYFLDTSKNHKRRWCSMEACGNRHKATEHYRRSRASK